MNPQEEPKEPTPGPPTPLFTIEQDFAGFNLHYFEGDNDAVPDGLPDACDTIFDLVAAWPRILAWLSADPRRQIGASLNADYKVMHQKDCGPEWIVQHARRSPAHGVPPVGRARTPCLSRGRRPHKRQRAPMC